MTTNSKSTSNTLTPDSKLTKKIFGPCFSDH
ncbi:hypothetical protein A5880_001201 [Enterococcus sp. 4G2_DIV0659]|uniref:Uncharacterized protein n=1 Tax=Candidatus Enterococcus mansonii TaxID=1834181 RepID=A0ABU8IDT8_9ENTE